MAAAAFRARVMTTSQPDHAAFTTPLHHDESACSGPGYLAAHSGSSAAQPIATPTFMRDAAQSMQFDMLPPPSSTHPSWQTLHDYAQSHASEHGYALSINTTAKDRSRIKLACVCYGQPKNTHKLTAETRIRKNRVSHKTGCKMWIEGKKQDDGSWLLRVGEPQHNHPGKASESWAVQRKRTWGAVGGRIGVGGVTAKEEATHSISGRTKDGDAVDEVGEEVDVSQAAIYNSERSDLIRKIVEQEMLYKDQPCKGRDRGVGRTVELLQSQFPDIHILRRDVYNVRAQIKRARKTADQGLEHGVKGCESENEKVDERHQVDGEEPLLEQDAKSSSPQHHCGYEESMSYMSTISKPHTTSSIGSSLAAQCRRSKEPGGSTSAYAQVDVCKCEQLQQENKELRQLLGKKTDEVEQRNIEIASLRTQLEYMSMVGMSGTARMAG